MVPILGFDVHTQHLVLAIVNILGGIAVLSSYAYGLWANPATRAGLWGKVPESLKSLYISSMLLAAGGYFAFTYFILFRLDPDDIHIAGNLTYMAFIVLYVLILVPSATWIPLTFTMLRNPGRGLWLAIRLVLATIGLASLLLLFALMFVNHREPQGAYWLAIGGCSVFFLHTAVLDAMIWPSLFPAQKG